MNRFLKRYILWLFYAVFLICAVAFGSREGLVATDSELNSVKYLLLTIFACFLVYSIHATRKENFFRSVGSINKLYWGRQIGIDLYIGVFLSLLLIYLVEGSILVVLLWAVPILVFANLAILPYILLNYGAIVGYFVS